MRSCVPAVALAVASVASSRPAAAVPDPDRIVEHGRTENVLALQSIGAAHAAHGHARAYAGAGARYARELSSHLELELGLSYLRSNEQDEVPAAIELLRPLRLSDDLELFAGGGPALVVVADRQMSVLPGGVLSVGAHVADLDGTTLRIELSYGAFMDGSDIVHESELGPGAALRF